MLEQLKTLMNQQARGQPPEFVYSLTPETRSAILLDLRYVLRDTARARELPLLLLLIQTVERNNTRIRFPGDVLAKLAREIENIRDKLPAKSPLITLADGAREHLGSGAVLGNTAGNTAGNTLPGAGMATRADAVRGDLLGTTGPNRTLGSTGPNKTLNTTSPNRTLNTTGPNRTLDAEEAMAKLSAKVAHARAASSTNGHLQAGAMGKMAAAAMASPPAAPAAAASPAAAPSSAPAPSSASARPAAPAAKPAAPAPAAAPAAPAPAPEPEKRLSAGEQAQALRSAAAKVEVNYVTTVELGDSALAGYLTYCLSLGEYDKIIETLIPRVESSPCVWAWNLLVTSMRLGGHADFGATARRYHAYLETHHPDTIAAPGAEDQRRFNMEKIAALERKELGES